MKSTSTALTNRIAAYKAQVDPLSIDPVLDGGIKQDLLDTLNNKARSKALLTLSAIPASDVPVSGVGSDGEYYIYLSPQPVVYFKQSGAWSAVESVNDMMFFNNGSDGVRRYFSFAEDLLSVVQIHEIDFGDISGSAVKYIPQTLTSSQKAQARDNIDAAAKAYVDNLFDQLIKSGAVGTECAGSVKPWFGLESTIPAGWVKIGNAQTWLLKADYPDLYAALGGESNPWGVTTTSFSLPFISEGRSLAQSGSNYPAFTEKGEFTHPLTSQETPIRDHYHYGLKKADSGQRFLIDYPEENPTALNSSTYGDSNYKTRIGSVNAEPDAGKSSGAKLIDTNVAAHNNLSPILPCFWIIKLANATNSAIIDSELSYKNVSVTQMSEGGVIIIPVGLYIADINIIVLSGDPSVSITELPDFGVMSGQPIYRNSANYKSTGNLTINMTGEGTIRIQIVKFNI